MEREKARHRWEDNASQDDSSGNRLIDSADMDALRVCQETTRAMVNAQAKRRPSVLIAIAAFVALGLVGGWFGWGRAMRRSRQASAKQAIVRMLRPPAFPGLVATNPAYP
jgi:hypothetical protein